MQFLLCIPILPYLLLLVFAELAPASSGGRTAVFIPLHICPLGYVWRPEHLFGRNSPFLHFCEMLLSCLFYCSCLFCCLGIRLLPLFFPCLDELRRGNKLDESLA